MNKDDEVMRDRAAQYGPAQEMWERIGSIQWHLAEFMIARCVDNDKDPTVADKAHLAAMNMNVVKMVRSVYDPNHADNYLDGRNYWTIAEMVGKKNE